MQVQYGVHDKQQVLLCHLQLQTPGTNLLCQCVSLHWLVHSSGSCDGSIHINGPASIKQTLHDALQALTTHAWPVAQIFLLLSCPVPILSMAHAQSARQHCMPAAANVCKGKMFFYQSFVMSGTLSIVSDWICWVSLGVVFLWVALCLTMNMSGHSMTGQQGDPVLHLAALSIWQLWVCLPTTILRRLRFCWKTDTKLPEGALGLLAALSCCDAARQPATVGPHSSCTCSVITGLLWGPTVAGCLAASKVLLGTNRYKLTMSFCKSAYMHIDSSHLGYSVAQSSSSI